MSFKVLNIVKPFVGFVPTVKKPERKIPFNEKIMWTGAALCIFLVYSQIPLFGIMSSESSDPFYWVRAILASNRGTLMELGISPIVTAGMIMQCLIGLGIVQVDNNIKEDQVKFSVMQKLLIFIMTFGQALVQIQNGFYGQPSDLGFIICTILIIQLMFSGIILVLIDEMLEIGYGMGSGTSLFIATNICETIFWKSFSPTVHNTGRGTEFEGSVVSLLHLLFTRKNKLRALNEAMYRANLPNISNLISTGIIFCTVMYLQGFRREIPIVGTKGRNYSGMYKVKLFYTSTMPIMLFSAAVSNVFFLSQMLYRNYPNNFIIQLLGIWEPKDGTSQFHAVSGISYYISPPHKFAEVYNDPIHFLVYLVFILTACAITSKLWIEVSGSSPKDVIRSFKEQNITIKGYRDAAIEDILTHIISTSAITGGVLIGLLSITADLIGAISSGTGILMAVSIIYSYTEVFSKESLETKNIKSLMF